MGTMGRHDRCRIIAGKANALNLKSTPRKVLHYEEEGDQLAPLA